MLLKHAPNDAQLEQRHEDEQSVALRTRDMVMRDGRPPPPSPKRPQIQRRWCVQDQLRETLHFFAVGSADEDVLARAGDEGCQRGNVLLVSVAHEEIGLVQHQGVQPGREKPCSEAAVLQRLNDGTTCGFSHTMYGRCLRKHTCAMRPGVATTSCPAVLTAALRSATALS